MPDERRFYISQILDNCKIPDSEDNVLYPVKYTYNGKTQHHYFFTHNNGIEFVKDYIKDLQDKIYKLQYVERIIQVAKEN